ncbi:MAG: hypothetical protein KME10_07205 [Plectolyngbya sp. WJT66-NPBG17]|jgi:hypothetical protein|nr:hypothetical protein [Plectolyngbya sp. WJT66-NPBG17]
MLIPKLMIEPSHWLGRGIKLEIVNGAKIFKFTSELQSRSDELLDHKKLGLITPDEQAELDGISELAQIFTYANSVLMTESQWSPNSSANSLHNANG